MATRACCCRNDDDGDDGGGTGGTSARSDNMTPVLPAKQTDKQGRARGLYDEQQQRFAQEKQLGRHIPRPALFGTPDA